MKLNKEDIENLLRLAEKAHPGPWQCRGYGIENKYTDTLIMQMDGADHDDELFIASANPTTIKSLCTEILRLREALEVAKEGLLKINNWPLNERGERKLPVFSHLMTATKTLTRIDSIMEKK